MTAAAPAGSRLQGTVARRRNERAIRAVLLGASVLSVLVSAGIVLSLIFEAVQFLGSIDLSQLFDEGWFPRRGMYSIPTVLVGSLLVTVIAIALAAPVGLGSAIYLAEYAKPRTHKIAIWLIAVFVAIGVLFGLVAPPLIRGKIAAALFR